MEYLKSHFTCKTNFKLPQESLRQSRSLRCLLHPRSKTLNTDQTWSFQPSMIMMKGDGYVHGYGYGYDNGYGCGYGYGYDYGNGYSYSTGVVLIWHPYNNPECS